MMKKYLLALCLLSLGVYATGCDNKTPTKATKTDYMIALEEKYSDYQEMEYGLDITLKEDIVSICYSTWFNPIVKKENPTIYNIQDVLDGKADWGPENAFHYWGKPALGYYRSDDKSVIRTHMTQLQEAGVDFIVIDNTNAQAGPWQAGQSNSYWDRMITQPCTVLLDTIIEMRGEGLKTPYVVFWNRVDKSNGWATPTRVYDEFYTNEKYKDCWVYWEGKPFLAVTRLTDEPGDADVSNFKHKDDMTLRQMTVAIIRTDRTLNQHEWSFLFDGPLPSKDDIGFYEHISVYVARQTTYMSHTDSAVGRNGGITFYNQWKRAFKTHPKVVTITWWNEWAAQRFLVDLDKDGVPESHFVDNYNADYSRDIEPMEGGHGDQYYRWMKEYIKAYKERRSCPILVEDDYNDKVNK